MKDNMRTPLIVATIVLLAVVAAYYGGLFAVTPTSAMHCVDDRLCVGEILDTESHCSYVSITLNELSRKGTGAYVSIDRGGTVRTQIYELGEKDYFEIDGCPEIWTVELTNVFMEQATFEICYGIPVNPKISLTVNQTTVQSGETIHITGSWDFDEMENRESMSLYQSLPVKSRIHHVANARDTGKFEYDWTAPTVSEKTSGSFQAVLLSAAGAKVTDKTIHITVNPLPSVPCEGLPPCGSDYFMECCGGRLWQCMWSNYDGGGFRTQWDPVWSQPCDADCVCDGAETGQECWCADMNPLCNGLSVCNGDYFLCEECCGGDVWQCQGRYAWVMTESCDADEDCECTGIESPECGCVAESTPTPTPTPNPADIEDSTDTLTFDKSSYQLGDVVIMYATGKNVGGKTWTGKVAFTLTQPDGTTYTIKESTGVSVAAGSPTTAEATFTLPADGQIGVWTAQSAWIQEDGTIDARSSILDLGETEDLSIYLIGGTVAFILLMYIAFRTKRGD